MTEGHYGVFRERVYYSKRERQRVSIDRLSKLLLLSVYYKSDVILSRLFRSFFLVS